MESPDDAPWSECGNGCGAMVEDPNWRKPAPWCPECQAAQYRGEFGLETDEQRLLRHLAEFNEAVADACNGLPDDTPDHVRAMADAINPAPECAFGMDAPGIPRHINSEASAEWSDGYCPACSERAAIVAWLGQSGMFLSGVADAIERGEHIDGLREGGGATRSSLGNRPPHLYDDDLLGLGDNCYESAIGIERGVHVYEGCLDGQMAERAAIVAWLRADGGDVCNAYADEIERGEHLGSDDDRPL